MKKIMFILDEFYPQTSAPSVRITSFAKELKKYDVHIVGGSSEKNPQVTGFTFHNLYRPREKSFVAFSVFLVMMNLKGLWSIIKEQPHTVIVSLPKYELLFFFPLFKLFSKRIILDVRDSINFINYSAYFSHFLPESVATPMGGIVKKIMLWFQNVAVKLSDHVTVANKGIADTIVKATRKQPVIISNGVTTGLFVPKKKPSTKIVNLVYLGNFAEKDSFTLLYEILPLFKKKIILHLIGEGRKKHYVLERLRQKNISFVDYGIQQHKDIPKIFQKMHVGIIFRDSDVNESIPVCLYEFCSMNIPVITNSAGIMSDFVKEHNTGWVVRSSQELKKLFKSVTSSSFSSLTLKRFEKLHNLAVKKFSRKEQAKRFAKLCIN